ncbi:hypothetical protein BS50DRAFT_571627 [Corynespora cassiicola Philippines]|uniref:Uncharacterized protein n=1 Tax=Corynespora cassiicola Philippines TaxID=1448308 RepID=A0A2T2NY79_CORCC|nr:hypothetical protein BS50DRAFT_571627 [Corynespora cassiicola Philippines]
MSGDGTNRAVTQDGETYNKLRRPDDYIASLGSAAPGASADSEPPKRKLEAADLIEDSTHRAKRTRGDNGGKLLFKNIQRGNDMAGGMKAAIGMEGEDGAEVMRDALAYLNVVRDEAAALPWFFTATKLETTEDDADDDEYEDGDDELDTYNQGYEDHGVVYNDGTVIAIDPIPTTDDDAKSEASEVDIQQEYYAALLRRYNDRRLALEPTKVAKRIAANPDSFSVEPPPKNNKEWIYSIDRVYPTPYMVYQLQQSEDNLWRGIDICARQLGRFNTISRQKSCWVWTLLSIVGERGTLTFWKQGKIRELGRAAAYFNLLLRNGEVVSKTGHAEDTDSDEEVEDIAPTEVDEEESAVDGDAYGGNQADVGVHDDSDEEGELSCEPELADTKATDAPVENRDEEGEVSDDSAAMDMSEDESTAKDDKASALEQARARLLAQLGDNLVSVGIPPQEGRGKQKAKGKERNSAHKNSIPPVRRSHRHNGKRCQDQSCFGPQPRKSKHYQSNASNEEIQPQQNVSQSPPEDQKSSTAEAEKRVEKQPEVQGSSKPLTTNGSSTTTPALKPPVFGSRAEAEAYKQQQQQQQLARQVDGGTEYEPESASESGDAEMQDQVGSRVKSEPESDSEAGDAEMQNSGEQGVDANTRATLEMIITVVAECYGQRDLLKAREVW